MNPNTDRARRDRNIRVLADRIQQHLRLQRELLWHPRLGLVGQRHPVPVAARGGRRTWTRR
jgi:hypothetical protein